MSARLAPRWDRQGVDVPLRNSTGARIAGILMNRRKAYSIVSGDDLFGPVAMMSVKIPDGNPFASCFQRMMCSNRQRIQITKAHGTVWSRMMPGRPHQRKNFLASQSELHRPDGRSGGAAGVLLNPRVIGRVSVKIDTSAQPFQMLWVMHSQNL